MYCVHINTDNGSVYCVHINTDTGSVYCVLISILILDQCTVFTSMLILDQCIFVCSIVVCLGLGLGRCRVIGCCAVWSALLVLSLSLSLSGRSTRKILEKLQSITAKQRQLEVRRPRFLPAETATPLDLSSTTRPRSQLPAPPCAAQLDPPPPPPTARSPHSATRLKTVPNILTRRKPPSPPLSPSPSPPVGWSESREGK